MFVIFSVDDKILLKPDDLNTNTEKGNLTYEEILLDKARNKYIGKILLNHGIVVSIKRFVLKSNLLVEIEGLINVEYDCDLIVFAPSHGDLLYGKIITSDYNEIIVDCEICKVKIPSEQLKKPCYFDDTDAIWYWQYGDNKLYYDIDEEVRVKVLETRYKSINDLEKIGGSLFLSKTASEVLSQNSEISSAIVMEIISTFNQAGLGPLQWWK